VHHCHGCGAANEKGLRLKSYWDGDEAVAQWCAERHHCGGTRENLNGGVIASLVGTFAVIEAADRALIRATLVNKFRGEHRLFEDGKIAIARHTNVPCLGPIPYLADAARLPAEDSLALDHAEPPKPGRFVVAVPRLPRIANFDDLDPLRAEPNVSVVVVEPGSPLPQSADLILIPGSKATRADLAALREAGWDVDVAAHIRAGKAVLGICGGYQMLGRTVADPHGIEGQPGVSEGLGVLAAYCK